MLAKLMKMSARGYARAASATDPCTGIATSSRPKNTFWNPPALPGCTTQATEGVGRPTRRVDKFSTGTLKGAPTLGSCTACKRSAVMWQQACSACATTPGLFALPTTTDGMGCPARNSNTSVCPLLAFTQCSWLLRAGSSIAWGALHPERVTRKYRAVLFGCRVQAIGGVVRSGAQALSQLHSQSGASEVYIIRRLQCSAEVMLFWPCLAVQSVEGRELERTA